MRVTRRALLAGAASVSWGRARAQQIEAIRIGLLTDLSGSTRDTSGPTSVACVRQAIDEMRAASPSLAVELLTADHQQKPDVGASVVREWFDRAGVDAVVGVNNSAIAFAVNRVVEDKDKVHLNTGAVQPTLPGRRAAGTSFTGRMIPGKWRTPPAARWWGQAGIPGSSSPPTTHSVMLCNAMRASSSSRPAGKCSARLSPVSGHDRFLVLPAPGASLRSEGRRSCELLHRFRQHGQASS